MRLQIWCKKVGINIKCFKNNYSCNYCTCTTSSNNLLLIFHSPLWSSKTSFREAYNHNESGSRYIISKEKRTQQSIEKGAYWKVFQSSFITLSEMSQPNFGRIWFSFIHIWFFCRSTSRTNNMAEVQNEIERIFELAKVSFVLIEWNCHLNVTTKNMKKITGF